MGTKTERISIFVTAVEKERIARRARRAGLSMGEFLRRAEAAFEPGDEKFGLALLAERVQHSTAAACASIDHTLSYIESSNRRIAAMEAEARRNA